MTKTVLNTGWRRDFLQQTAILCRLATLIAAMIVGTTFTTAFAKAEEAGQGNLSPASVIQAAINDVATDMRNNAKTYETDKKKLHEMVLRSVDTYFNFGRMAQLAMARHAASATPEQRNAIIREFKISFIRSYANTLFEYRNVNPTIQQQPDSDDKKSTVKMNVKSESGESTTLFLRLEKTGSSWKIIDVTAEGVSLVINARGQFSETIAKDGIDGLIKSLTEENRKNSP